MVFLLTSPIPAGGQSTGPPLAEASSDLAETPTNLAMSSIFTGAGSSLVRSVRALAMDNKLKESNLNMLGWSLLAFLNL